MPHQKFQPFSGMFLRIGEAYFEFLPHPSLLGEKDGVYCLEGGSAFIYKIADVDTGLLYALKVFKSGFRDKQRPRP